jgi:hypothetical protein
VVLWQLEHWPLEELQRLLQQKPFGLRQWVMWALLE